MRSLLIISLFSLIILSIQQDTPFDYTNNGTDWVADHLACDKDYSNQAPLNIVRNNSLPFKFQFYIFPSWKENVSGQMNLENFNNNLVFNAANGSVFGSITFMLNNTDINLISEVTLTCDKIFFRMPGEHVIEGKRYDAEIQLNCSNKDVTTFFAIPVSISDTSGTFLKSFLDIKLNNTISISSTQDIFSPVLMFYPIYHYQGSVNFPECDLYKYWIFVDKPLQMDKSVYASLWTLLDKTKAPTGNSRQASDPSTGDGIASTVWTFN